MGLVPGGSCPWLIVLPMSGQRSEVRRGRSVSTDTKVGPIEARDHAAFSGVLSAAARREGRTSEPDEATAS